MLRMRGEASKKHTYRDQTKTNNEDRKEKTEQRTERKEGRQEGSTNDQIGYLVSANEVDLGGKSECTNCDPIEGNI